MDTPLVILHHSTSPVNFSRNQTMSKRVVVDDEEKTTKKRRRTLLIDEDEEEEEDYIVPKKEEKFELRPLGVPIQVLGEGKEMKSFFGSLFYSGVEYYLEDTVLLEPEHEEEKPYVAKIKEISKTQEDPLKITVQWLYRPEEAAKPRGDTYKSLSPRELFLSFHRDEVHAESVKHKCAVYFVPLTKQIPNRKKHPGFFVQYLYDFENLVIYSIADKDYLDEEQREIDRCLRKTIEELGDLPDLEPKQVKNERLDPRRRVSPVDVSPLDNGSLNVDVPERISDIGSEVNYVLSSFKFLTDSPSRNMWLEKLLESVTSTSPTMNHNPNGNEEGSTVSKWSDKAVYAVAALEQAAHSALFADTGKYMRKMRQLVFNLKNNDLLAQRLLNKELEPAQILNMSPEELKTGSIAQETPSREPEDVGYLQMTEASCANCSKKQVALMNIFKAGVRNRYQMECQACGTSSTLTM